jgi:hypothetical protein
LEDGEAGRPTKFTVVTRNSLGENRTSGRDKISVSVYKMGGSSSESDIPIEIRDLNNGTYQVTYTPPINGGEVQVKVAVADASGVAVVEALGSEVGVEVADGVTLTT